ncbi:MAG: hypothetical protein IJD11_04040, partial [Oscillospiraceae bacterium]|nr:hypothetical protein [Oscillospiraceae bacterium]
MRFQIIGNQISRTDKDIVTTRNVNYITCTFDFDESYRDLSLYAVFYRNEEQNFVVDVTNGECLFPWELLETAGVIYVGAYGVKGSTDTLEKRATTNAVVIRVVDSLSSDNLPELTPTPDVWEQYRAEVLGYRDATKLYTAQAETYATEAEGNAVTAVRSASQA